MSLECQICINNNIQYSLYIIAILSVWSANTLGGNLFVKGSTIIRWMLICYIDTLCFWTSSLW